MYFSKISLCRYADTLKKLNQYIYKSGYYYHQLIWQLFSENNPNKTRDFLYRAVFDRNWPVFYTVSAVKPVDNNGLWQIESQPYQPALKTGEILRFNLRVNPRICRTTDTGKRYYVDIIQDAFYKNKTANSKNKIKAEIIQETGEKWLITRAEKNGFVLQSVIADNFQKHRFEKNKHPHPVSFSTLDYQGCLKVIDTEKFISALMHGVGAAKGFGCGLLMVKRYVAAT